LNKEISLKTLRLNKRIKVKIEEAIALNEMAASLLHEPQNINLNFVNLNDDYTYKKYVVDNTCRLDCPFEPREEKEIKGTAYKETLILEPYSVVLIVMDRRLSVPAGVKPVKKKASNEMGFSNGLKETIEEDIEVGEKEIEEKGQITPIESKEEEPIEKKVEGNQTKGVKQR